MSKKSVTSNNIQICGNKESMNLNSMILTNIQSSTYFKQKLVDLKTYHEVIDEIYYRVNHLEPWEKGSRRTQGLTGMCGGVRGVGGGGIVSTAFCLLYKLYTLKLTRKQLIGLMTHQDSPFIRALGFMYVRYTQSPQDLYGWFADFLDDEEELDVKAGGGAVITIGQMLRQWLTRLEWYDTLFPRIPVPIQNEILFELRSRYGNRVETAAFYEGPMGASSGSREINRRTPPPEITEILKSNEQKSSRSSRSLSRTRERSKSPRYRSKSPRHRRRSRSRSLKRKSTERSPSTSSKHKHHRSKRRHRSKSGSSSDVSENTRHHHHHHKSSRKRDEDDEERHKHRRHKQKEKDAEHRDDEKRSRRHHID